MRECVLNLCRRRKALFRNALVVGAGLLLPSIIASAHAEDATRYQVNGRTLYVHISSLERVCPLDDEADYAISSYDESALIISARGYVPTADVMQCDADKKLHVINIPEKVGALSDINLSKKIYVALDFATIKPLAYVATVAHIGSSRNLISLRGAASAEKDSDKDRRHSFLIRGDMAGSAIISLDGRYVAPSGVIECDENAYPGV